MKSTLDTLTSLAHRLRGQQSIGQIGQVLFDALRELYHPTMGGLGLTGPDGLQIVDSFNTPTKLLTLLPRTPPDHSLIEQAKIANDVRFFRNIQDDERLLPEMRHLLASLGIASQVTIPIAYDTEVKATVVLGFGPGRNLTEEDLEVLSAMGQMTALAMQELETRQHLEQQVQQRVELETRLLASESKYRTLFEGAGDGIFLLSPEGNIEINDSAKELIGRQKVISGDWADWGDRPSVQPNGRFSTETLQEKVVAAQKAPQHFEWRYEKADGTIVDSDVSMTTFDLEDGSYLLTIVRDITDFNRARRRLLLANKRLSTLSEFQRSILMATDPRALAKNAIARIAEMVPVDRVAVLERRDVDEFEMIAVAGLAERQVGEGTLVRLPPPIMQSLLEGQPSWLRNLSDVASQSVEFSQLKNEGMNTALIVPMTTAKGLTGALGIGLKDVDRFESTHMILASEIANLLAIAMDQATMRKAVEDHAATLERSVEEKTQELAQRIADIERINEDMETLATDLKKANKRLKENTKKLTAANQDLKAFVSSVSEDLDKPLQELRVSADRLFEIPMSHLDEHGRDYLERISHAIDRMDRMLRGLLRYVHISRQAAAVERVDLDAAVREACSALEPLIDERQGTITIQGPLPPVMAHHESMTQVLLNLLSNAVKYSAPDRPPEVTIKAETKDDQVVIAVQDNGRGIAARDIPRLFNVFERLGSSRDSDGTGIGLAIVKRAVERMQGSISVVSEPGKGTTFTITLLAPQTPGPGTRAS